MSWDGDSLVGSNTDGAGFVSALGDAGVDVDGANVVVIGAGGAARSVIDALGRAGSRDIRVVNRTDVRAQRAAQLAAVASVGTHDDVARADVVVNATSVGMGIDPVRAADDDFPCAPDLLRVGQVVVDLVYHPLRTPWLGAAAAMGVQTVDGLGMLVHQAVLQQQRWLGVRPDPQVMRSAAEQELASR